MTYIEKYDKVTAYDKLLFVCTCESTPEQYEVFDREGNQVAYVRLRGGYLSVEYPDTNGELIYEHSFSSRWKGCFSDDNERKKFLDKIYKLIIEHINSI